MARRDPGAALDEAEVGEGREAQLLVGQSLVLLTGALMDVGDLVRTVDPVIRCGTSASIPSVTVMPRRPMPS